MDRDLYENYETMSDMRPFRDLRLLIHLLVALFVHGIADEMSVPFLTDVVTRALCPGSSSCSDVLYLNVLHQTASSFLMIGVLPFLCELSDEFGRRPLLLLTLSTSIFPIAALVLNQSPAFVYAYYVLRSLSYIISLRSIFCISIAYAADIVEEDKRVAAFSWITGVISASHILGTVIAKIVPGKYTIGLSLVLLVMCPVYVQLFVGETVRRAHMIKMESVWIALLKPIKERYRSIRYAASLVISRPTLRGIYKVSFFYEFGMAGISSVLLFYLKAAFDFDKDKSTEMLMVVQIGSVASQMFIVPIINALAGEKAILCMGLLASVTYGFFYSMAWESWLPYISVSLGLAYGFVKPSICAIVSKASSSDDQGKAQGCVAAVESIAGFISPLIMTPLTVWFLSSNRPFDLKGFSFMIAALSMMAAFFFAKRLTPETTLNHDLKAVLLT